MAISKSKATSKDSTSKGAKASSTATQTGTKRPEEIAKGTETNMSETPKSDTPKQRKKASEESREGTTVEIITPQEDATEEVQEVFNQDEEANKDNESDDESEVISVDLSDMNENEEGVTGFITHYWDGAFPEATGALAKLFATTATADQIMQLEVMITVSNARRPQVLLGDLTDVFTPFVVAVPGLGRTLKVVYAVHSGAAHDLFKDTVVEDKLVCLTGEFVEGLQIPSTLILPKSCLECIKVKVPDGESFNKKRLDSNNSKETWFKSSAVEGAGLVPPLMPVPAFLVYDSFDTGIDAMVLYERWMKARTHDINSYIKYNTVFRAFCKAQVVTTTTKDVQTRIKASYFMEQAPPVTHEWKRLVLSFLFGNKEKEPADDQSVMVINNSTPSPTLQNQEEQPKITDPILKRKARVPFPPRVPPPTTTDPSPPSTPEEQPPLQGTPLPFNKSKLTIANQQLKDLSLEQFVTVVATAAQTAVHAAKETKQGKSEKESPMLGMCKAQYDRLVRMCGLAPGEEDGIPDIWKQLSDKDMQKPMKKSLVKQWISKHEYFPEVKVISYASLVKMIIDMDFEEDTTRSSRKSAAKGLTLFAVPTLSDREVDTMEDHSEALEAATQTTVKDLEKLGIQAEGPKSFQTLRTILKRFANLLYALFGINCPLFREILVILQALDAYGEAAIKATSVQTLVSITWIVHLQARRFSAGLMDDSEEALLSEFSSMLNSVKAKQPIVYADVPLDMYSTPSNEPTGDPTNKRGWQQTWGAGNPVKKLRLRNLQKYHPTIKEKMEVFKSRTKLPRIKALCEASNIKAKELFPKELFPSDNFCQKSALFGTCFADCTREHKAVTDEQANHIVTKLKPALDNPDSVKVTP